MKRFLAIGIAIIVHKSTLNLLGKQWRQHCTEAFFHGRPAMGFKMSPSCKYHDATSMGRNGNADASPPQPGILGPNFQDAKMSSHRIWIFLLPRSKGCGQFTPIHSHKDMSPAFLASQNTTQSSNRLLKYRRELHYAVSFPKYASSD